MRVTLLLLLPVLLTNCAHFECTAHGGSEVRSLTTEHFVVTSDLPAAQHRAEAERLELLWDTFAAFFQADVEAASIPVVVLQSGSDVDAFAPGYVGFVTRSDPEALVVGAPAEPGGHDVNAHELTHLVSAYLLPRQPRWVAEGLAALFEDATFKDARTVRMGRWNAGRAQDAFILGVASLEELNAWGALTFDGSEGHLYSSAWAWIHYLANHDEARLKRLMAQLQSSKPFSQVMAEVFPPADAAQLREAVQAYLGEARFRGWETQLRRTPTVRDERVLAPWEVHRLRSRLWLKDEAAPQRDLAQVVALSPSPRPPAVEVVAAQLEKRDLSQLLKASPSSPEVLVAAHRAGLKLDADALAAAVAEDGTNASLLLAAAEASERPEAVEAFASRGFALAPWSPRLALLLVNAAFQRGECALAEQRLSLAVALLPERRSAGLTKHLAELEELLKSCRTPVP